MKKPKMPKIQSFAQNVESMKIPMREVLSDKNSSVKMAGENIVGMKKRPFKKKPGMI